MNDRHGNLTTGHGAITTLSVRLLRSSATRGRLSVGPVTVPCAIGRSGVTRRKREGDGASPAGSLRVLGGYYRPDRFPVRPATALALKPIRRRDGWCDDPADANYNRPVRLPHPASHEAMARDDGLYDIVLVLDWNLAPRRRGRGSAIFFHLARPDFAPTAGCLAVRRSDMLKILRRLAPGTRVRFA